MISATTCPHCQSRVSGDLRKLADHVAACKKKVLKGKPLRAPRRVGFELPNLPVNLGLKRPTPSQNETTGWHWTRKAKEATAWVEALRIPILIADLHDARLDWSRWRIERRYTGRQRPFDYGNLVGGCKHLLDALKTLNVIEDDAPDHFEAEYIQTKYADEAQAGTVISLIDARL